MDDDSDEDEGLLNESSLNHERNNLNPQVIQSANSQEYNESTLKLKWTTQRQLVKETKYLINLMKNVSDTMWYVKLILARPKQSANSLDKLKRKQNVQNKWLNKLKKSA